MSNNIPKVYDPKQVEDRIYEYWEEQNYFHAEPDPEKDPYTIVIPPPNVTAVLHMGHAYNNSLQDIFIRWKRMQGYSALWMPGTDHAGIATQNVVEKELRKEDKTRHDLGREAFIEKAWDWARARRADIINQLKKMGSSCDWERERFTFDEGLSKAVTHVFVELYNKGLIYRDSYIVNWCPRCSTVISDEEVEHENKQGHLWHMRYPLKDSDEYIVVATTRPETMLGDTGVAVNPEDDRYRDMVGKTVILPLLNREIPIIADNFVDPEFGTGMVKVTPAHDPNDFEMGNRNDLKQINVLNDDATMNKNAGDYQGLDRFEARKKIVRDLEAEDLLEKTEKYENRVGHCYRCHTIVEPSISDQWFVRMKPLAEPAIEAVNSGQIKFYPEKWVKTYNHWMENIRDWCISRQLWWGHRIPAYYCEDCDHLMVAEATPDACDECGGSNIRQDDDVLDTWFSSWLWPFSTMDWPEETPELKYFYPTDTLVTAQDIIFFWVARMIMAGFEFMDDIPFKNVYFNGIVRDDQGRKMSKSLGNGIDPLEMVKKYSADAVRYSLIVLSTEGQDINLAEENFEIGRNFSNKLWNSFRFVEMQRDGKEIPHEFPDQSQWELTDRWIVSRLQNVIRKYNAALDRFRVHEAQDTV
ncbi:MAG: valine--tRNA ligase, partial [Candidatus Marinimicrobia bacterium]|nr:valine--tRNA ligase [Candidatus Neomarinimicrobiota bacterium]